MPIILIIVGVIVALGLGTFFYSNQTPTKTRAAVVTEIKATSTLPTDTPTESTTSVTTTTTSSTTATEPTLTPTATTVYQSAEFSAESTYIAPSRAKHKVNVTLTIANDIVTNSSVTFGGDVDKTSAGYQAKFTAAYKAQVVGKSLNSIALARVGGASLATGAYNNALTQIKTNAKL